MPVEGRGFSSRQTQQVVRDRRLGNLSTPKSVQKLQTALHAKAKAEAGYRFFCLFFFYCCGDHRDLHSFPTRRSSDLAASTGGSNTMHTGARYIGTFRYAPRSEEHTSELQSRLHLVCRLLLEKKKQ